MNSPSGIQPLVDVGPSAVLHCAACGYDLSGIDPDGRCPECAMSIADSRAADLLRRAFGGPVLTKAILTLGVCIAIRLAIRVLQGGLLLGALFGVPGGVGGLGIHGAFAAANAICQLVEVVAWFAATSQPVITWFRGARPWGFAARLSVLVAIGWAFLASIVPWFLTPGALVWVFTGMNAARSLFLIGPVGFLHVLGGHPPIGLRGQTTLWCALGLLIVESAVSVVAYVVASGAPAGTTTVLGSGVVQFIFATAANIAVLAALAFRVWSIHGALLAIRSTTGAAKAQQATI